MQEKAEKEKEKNRLAYVLKEMNSMNRHTEFLVRSRAEEKEMRLKETKKRKATEQLMKALRTR